MSKLNDGIHIKGKSRLTYRDALTGKFLYQTPWRDNLVTTAGKVLYARLMKGETLDPCGYCGVGSGDTPAAIGDTALETEIGRLTITDVSITGAAVTYSTFFGSADCNGGWWEIGLLTLATGGTLIARTVLGAEQTKNAANTITLDYTLTVA